MWSSSLRVMFLRFSQVVAWIGTSFPLTGSIILFTLQSTDIWVVPLSCCQEQGYCERSGQVLRGHISTCCDHTLKRANAGSYCDFFLIVLRYQSYTWNPNSVLSSVAFPLPRRTRLLPHTPTV